MRIIKRLSKENVARTLSGRIRVGSLRGYRATEDEKRKDLSEGLRPKHVEAPEEQKLVLGKEELNRVFSATASPYRVNDARIKFSIASGKKFTSSSLFNTLVFCSTIESASSDYLNMKYGEYRIEIFNIDVFVELVMMALNKELHHKKSVKMLGTATGIACTHDRVRYSDKKSIKIDDVAKLSDVPSIDLTEIFVKPDIEDFKIENEYRFAWYPYSPKDETICSIDYGLEYIDLFIPNIGEAVREAT